MDSIPTQTAPSITKFKENRFNFGAMLIDAFGYPLGMSFLSAATIIPLFLQKLGASNVLIGLVPALASLGTFLPQLMVSNFIESLPIKKKYLLILAIVERLPFLALVPLTLLLAKGRATALIAAFFACWAINNVCMGCNQPAYFSVLGKVIPPDRRGSLFGIGGAIGGILGLAGAWGAGLALTELPFPLGFAVCFLVGFIILTITVLPFGFLIESPVNEKRADENKMAYLSRCFTLLKGNKNFLRYILVQILYSFGYMPSAFFTIFSIDNLHATTENVAVFNGVILAVSTIFNIILGYAADKHGHRKMVLFSIVIGAIAIGTAAVSSSIITMYAAFALITISATANGLSGTTILLDFAPESQIPTYTAISGTVTAPLRFAAPLLGGIMADTIGYWPLFAISAAAFAMALVITGWFITDPRAVE